MGKDDNAAVPAVVLHTSEHPLDGSVDSSASGTTDKDEVSRRTGATAATASSHDGSTTSMTSTPRSSSLNTISSTNSAATSTVSTAPLSATSIPAAVDASKATHNSVVPITVNQHPLSPDDDTSTSKRTSYFMRPSILPGTSAVSNVIFKEDDEKEDGMTSDPVVEVGDATSQTRSAFKQIHAQPSRFDDRQDGNSSNLVESPALIDPSIQSLSQSPTFSLRLPQAPHLLPAELVDERLKEATQHPLGSILLARELARQLEESQAELASLRRVQECREQRLLALLRETGSVTESTITRALVRANAEAAESAHVSLRVSRDWRIVIGSRNPLLAENKFDAEDTKSRPPLADDLQDAMSEADFKETARSVSPTMPLAIHRGSPTLRQAGSSSPASFASGPLHERRGRQASQSLSARLFGGFTPPTTSYLSPTSDAFNSATQPSSASSIEGSPGFIPSHQVKKSRADSIRSVGSTSSQHAKGISGWAGSLWGWNKSGKTRYFSDEEEDEGEEASGDEATPIASEAFAQARAEHNPSHTHIDFEHDKHTPKRNRTFSKSSANSTSTKSFDTTAATSVSSNLGQPKTLGQQVTESTSAADSTPSRTSTVTVDASPKLGKSISGNKEGPVKSLLARRPSGLHPDAALTTHIVTTPVSAGPSPRTASSVQSTSAVATSTSILQTLHSQTIERSLSDSSTVGQPSHFRAVSESASTIGKSDGKRVSATVFRSPAKVSDNISQWTHNLLASFQPAPAILTTVETPISAEMDRSGSTSPSTSRSKSPRIHQGKSKATPSPATILSGSTSTPVTLSANTVTSKPSSTPFPMMRDGAHNTEAMPMANGTVTKPKGYISSAKGTIGRALGFGNSGPKSTLGNGSTASPRATFNTMSKHGSDSIKSSIEPAVTVPGAFSSFSKGTRNGTHVAASPASGGNSQAAPLEMGAIIAPESKPPTLSNELSQQMKDGPLVDRFGFVYDVKVGMKLLKEHRKKRKIIEEDVITLASTPAPAVNVADLREAIGPSPAVTPAIETALEGSALDLSAFSSGRDVVPTKSTPSGSVKSSNVGDSGKGEEQLPSNQSIRRLLNQLGEMNESVEKAQKDGWDNFIRKRRYKANRPHHKDEEMAAAAKARKRQTLSEVPLSMGLGVDTSLQEENQFSDYLIGVASMGADKQDDKTFRQLVRSGIPIVYRPAIWAEVSGASELREPGAYQDLLRRHEGEASPCLEQIDMDTHRTFPTNVFFAGSGPGVAKLRRVLIAYSWRDPAVGYCQGMNLLAALLLLVYPDEEDAFWMLASVLERTLPSDYYSSQLLVSQADQRVLQDLIQIALPDLYDHLEELGVDLPAITFGWFLSLFTDALPIQTLLRVWDVLLVYGPISLFKIAIAIFKIHSAEIFATDSASNFYVLLTNLTSHMYSADRLLKTAFEELRFIKRHDIETRRLKHVADIERELAPRQMSITPTSTTVPSPELPASTSVDQNLEEQAKGISSEAGSVKEQDAEASSQEVIDGVSETGP